MSAPASRRLLTAWPRRCGTPLRHVKQTTLPNATCIATVHGPYNGRNTPTPMCMQRAPSGPLRRASSASGVNLHRRGTDLPEQPHGNACTKRRRNAVDTTHHGTRRRRAISRARCLSGPPVRPPDRVPCVHKTVRSSSHTPRNPRTLLTTSRRYHQRHAQEQPASTVACMLT